MRHVRNAVSIACLFAVALALLPGRALAANEKKKSKADARETLFFETEVRPILAANCFKCHSDQSDRPKGGLRLDSREAILKGGKTGPAIDPGKPHKSLLIESISGKGKLQMPPKKALPENQVEALSKWVKMGAPWPENTATAGVKQVLATPTTKSGKPGSKTDGKWDPSTKYEQIRKEHWAFQPVKDIPAPDPKLNAAWAKSDIDRYVLAKLNEAEIVPSKPADKRTLIRRATFDLTGLPPTPEEVEAFVNDASPKAFEKVVDRLLASKAFGERWGRHWLDVARYAESTGMTRNAPYYYAWRYRDYVIDSLNADKPYDRFVKEQIAGDLMTASNGAQRDEQTIATGFLAIGQRDINEKNPLQFALNVADEQIDATTRAFLGMTVACARCHDHKFDPIPTADYYSLAGIFRSTETLNGTTPRRGPVDVYNPEMLVPLSKARDGKTEVSYDAGVVRFADVGPETDPDKAQQKLRKRARELLERGGEKEVRPVALGVKDGRLPFDSTIFVRGEPADRGAVVPRGTITLPGLPSLGNIPPDHSGRLELANWLASRKNPLTARVMVNRIWSHLFGEGLVPSVDNFGTTGEAPTHPELLDHLAKQFMDDGWSVKHAIRRMMLSSTYQQSGVFDERRYSMDPDNHLLWRMPQRRLEGESIRDAMLATSGTLTKTRPTSVVMDVPPVDLARAGRFADRFLGGVGNVRSVYLPIIRGMAPPALDVFDLADNSQVTGERDVTTVAPQALFMMNDRFVLAQAREFAKRVTSERTGDAARIDRAYSLALGRTPSDAERTRMLSYVKDFAKDESQDRRKREQAEAAAWASVCQALMASAEFRYVN